MALWGALTHRKTRRLARLLDIPIPCALGVMEALWHVTAAQAPTGAIGALSNADLAEEMFWPHDPDALVAALVSAGLLDKDPDHRLIVHHWSERADESVRKRLLRSNQQFVDGPVRKRRTTADNGGQRRTTADDNGRCPPARAMPEPEPCQSQSHASPPNPLAGGSSDGMGSAGTDLLPDGTRRLTEQELAAVERSAERIGLLMANVNPATLAKVRRCFSEGYATPAYWDHVTREETEFAAQQGRKIKSLAYFVECVRSRDDGEDAEETRLSRNGKNGHNGTQQALAVVDPLEADMAEGMTHTSAWELEQLTRRHGSILHGKKLPPALKARVEAMKVGAGERPDLRDKFHAVYAKEQFWNLDGTVKDAKKLIRPNLDYWREWEQAQAAAGSALEPEPLPGLPVG